jgi:hypothetical protein
MEKRDGRKWEPGKAVGVRSGEAAQQNAKRTRAGKGNKGAAYLWKKDGRKAARGSIAYQQDDRRKERMDLPGWIFPWSSRVA